MITLDQRVEAALEILAPRREKRRKARDEVQSALAEIDLSCANADALQPLSKAGRAELRRLLAALRRAQSAAGKMRKHSVEWDLFPLDLSKHIRRCEQQLEERPARRGHRSPLRQRLAVAKAYALVREFGQPEDHAVARGTKWHALAAVLYGEPGRDLFRHMLQTFSG